MVGQIFELVVFQILYRTLPCQHHISGIPRKFIAPRIVVALGRNQPTAIRPKFVYFSALCHNFIYDFKRTYVVYARV